MVPIANRGCVGRRATGKPLWIAVDNATGTTKADASKGKAMGRGLDHFRTEVARLISEPTGDDPYEDEAYRLWKRRND